MTVMILLRLFYLKDEAACYSFQYKLKKGCDIEEDLVSFERLSKLAFISEMRGRSKAKVYWQIEKKGNTSYSFQFLKELDPNPQCSFLLSSIYCCSAVQWLFRTICAFWLLLFPQNGLPLRTKEEASWARGLGKSHLLHYHVYAYQKLFRNLQFSWHSSVLKNLGWALFKKTLKYLG